MSTSTDVGGGLLRLLLCGTMRAFVSHDDDLGGGRWADARTEDWDGARGRPTAPQTPDRSGTWDGNPVERLGTGGSHGSHITSPLSRRKLLTLVALALAAVLVAVATLAEETRLLGAKPTSTPVTAVPVSTLGPTPTVTPTFAPTPPPLPPGMRGWTKIGPDYGAVVMVAPSQPTTIYTCGSRQAANGAALPSYLGVSHDSGQTWQTLTLPAVCGSLQVSPTNAQTLAFGGDVCAGVSGGCGAPADVSHFWVYRSGDGGLHWTHLTLPPDPQAAAAPDDAGFAWAGATLFVAPISNGNPALLAHKLAASTNGAPLTWVDQNGLQAQMSSGDGIVRLTGVGGTMFVTTSAGNCANQFCATVARSSDGGASWSAFNPMYQGEDLQVMAGMPNGTLLALPSVANSPTRALLRSADNGSTWSALPLLPGGARPSPGFVSAGYTSDSVYVLPDGTTIAEAGDFSGNIYKLASGAATWTLVAAPPTSGQGSTGSGETIGILNTVTWDTSGHPRALWAGSVSFPGTLYTHAA